MLESMRCVSQFIRLIKTSFISALISALNEFIQRYSFRQVVITPYLLDCPIYTDKPTPTGRDLLLTGGQTF